MNQLVPKVITLTVYDPSCSSYGITWQTQKEGKPVIEYREIGGEVTVIIANCSESIGTIKNSAVIANLKYNCLYEYRVGDNRDNIFSEWSIFKTLEKNPKEVSFYYFADTQDHDNLGEWWKDSWKHAKRNYPNAAITVHGGDMVQLSGSAELWEKMIDINSEFVRSMPMIACSGNHDYWDGYLFGYTSTFEKHFKFNYTNQDTTAGIYYSMNIGPAHFVVLNSGASTEENSEQYNWLIDDLKSTDRKWKIVIIHNPLYSPGKYGSRPSCNGVALELRKNLNKVFAEYEIDLVLNGHDHVYSKSYPIMADGTAQKDYEFIIEKIDGSDFKVGKKLKGPIHFVTGCSGNQNRNCHDNIDEKYLDDLEEYCDTYYNHVCYSYVMVNNDGIYLTYNMISRDTGESVVKYSFGIKK